MKNQKWIIIGISVIIIFTISITCFFIVFSLFWYETGFQNIFAEYFPQSNEKYISVTITAEKGGIVELLDDTRLEIPPGAFDHDVVVSISKTTESLNISDEFLGEAIIREINIENASIIKPITLSFKYDDLINNDLLSPDAVYIAGWDGTQWAYLGGEVNSENKTISIKIDHLSTFGVFGFPSLDSLFESLKSLRSLCLAGKIDNELTQTLKQIIQANTNDISNQEVKVSVLDNLRTFSTNEVNILVDKEFFNQAAEWLPAYSKYQLLEPMLAHELSHLNNLTTEIDVISEILHEASYNLSLSDFLFEIGAYISNLKHAFLDGDCSALAASINKLTMDMPKLVIMQFIQKDYCLLRKQAELNADLDGVQWAGHKNNNLTSIALVYAHYFRKKGEQTACTYPSGVVRANNILSKFDLGNVGGIYGRIYTIGYVDDSIEDIFTASKIYIDGLWEENIDAQGRFLITELPPGQHTLSLTIPGYKQIKQIVKVPYQRLENIDLTVELDEGSNCPIPEIEDYAKIYLGGNLIFDLNKDAGCFSVGGIFCSPTNEHFLIVPHCLEGDNLAFIFNKDGSGKREITGQWDYVNFGNIDWSPDGEWIIYQRINSFGAPVHPEELPEGLVLYNVSTGEKTIFYSKSGPPTYGYPTSPAWSPDGRWIAFLYERYNAPLTVYLLESNLSSQWKLDEFEYQDNYGTLEWEMNEDEQFMNLNYFEIDGEIPDRTYVVSTSPGVTPPGTPVPLNDEPDQKLYYITGVQIGDVLNIRSQPGPEHPKVGEIPHDGRNVQITGEGVMVGIRMWVPVNYGGMTGWVNSKFLVEQSDTETPTIPVLQQLVVALDEGDVNEFEKLLIENTIEYGTGMAGGRTPIPREEFLRMIAERIASSPECIGYTDHPEHITVWTSGWEPDWEYSGNKPSDVINFSFFDHGDGLSLAWAHFAPLPGILTVPSVDSKPCPSP